MAKENESRAKEIQEWMESIAKRQKPRTKLIFNRDKKILEAVPESDPRADDSLVFDKEEARRFFL